MVIIANAPFIHSVHLFQNGTIEVGIRKFRVKEEDSLDCSLLMLPLYHSVHIFLDWRDCYRLRKSFGEEDGLIVIYQSFLKLLGLFIYKSSHKISILISRIKRIAVLNS